MKASIPFRFVPRPEAFARGAIVTRAMVHARTRELAGAAGRDPTQVTQADYEIARREVTGESDFDRQESRLDATPEGPGATARCSLPSVSRCSALADAK